MSYNPGANAQIIVDKVAAGEIDTPGKTMALKAAIEKLPEPLQDWTLDRIREVLQQRELRQPLRAGAFG